MVIQITEKRFHGKFYTPLKFAGKALEYIENTAGKEWWKTGKYRIWDMAAGTGNLELHLPPESYKYLYLSTLFLNEVEHCKKIFSQATVFQYDYLNDDVENVFANGSIDKKYTWKLPEKLRKDLSNPDLKWLIFINPPYATSQTAGANSKSKKDVSNTEVRKEMHKQNLGEVSRELFSQFIFRIKKEFSGKQAYFGLFSKLSYLVANNDEKLRTHIFKFQFEQGFMFSSANFSDTSRNTPFPVGFLIWNLSIKKELAEQEIILDIFDNNVVKIGQKQIGIVKKTNFLSKWFKRPATTKKFPPVGSAIKVKLKNKDRRDRIAEKFIASLMCNGNDFQRQNYTAIASAPFVSAGALSVTPDNFEKAMVVHAVRRIPKATWLNDRDQFMQPKQELSREFINDCIIWNILSNSNQTAAMKDVEYEGNIYQITNHFFPFLIKELKKWEITDNRFLLALTTAENRFVARYLDKIKLSKEAKDVLKVAKVIYKYYFCNLHKLRTNLFKIETWDAGFWQIKKALQDQDLCSDLFENLKEEHSLLRNKILPQIYDYEFIAK